MTSRRSPRLASVSNAVRHPHQPDAQAREEVSFLACASGWCDPAGARSTARLRYFFSTNIFSTNQILRKRTGLPWGSLPSRDERAGL